MNVGKAFATVITTFGSPSRLNQLVTATDWQEIRALVQRYKPSPAAVQIGLAHAALDSGDLKLALIDGGTACEVSLNECLRSPAKSVMKALQSFWTLPLAGQLAAVTMLKCPDWTPKQLEDALTALHLRNRVVHEGWSPQPEKDVHVALMALLHLLARLLDPIPFKFPTLDPSNCVLDEWS